MRLLMTFCTAVLLVIAHTLSAKTPASSSAAANASQPVHPASDHIAVASAQQHLHLFSATVLSAAAQDDDEKGLGIISDEHIRIINLGPAVNYEGLDYAPTISADGKTLYFVSDREGSIMGTDGERSHDFWYTTKEDNYDTVFTGQPENLEPDSPYGKAGTNTPENEGVASISADQQLLVFTGCDRDDGIGGCDLYTSEIEAGGKWGLPKNLGRNVNSEDWDSQPSIAPDKSRIYFASNRSGSVGGGEDMDIWYTDFDFEFEEWQEAKNLGPTVNTEQDDWSPFINADNTTLFFSSQGHVPSIGGFDFYITRRDEADNWTTPENIGRPINTEADEFFISAPASGDIIYFASTREDIKGYQGDFDIFMAFVPTFTRVQVLTGVVLDECSDANIPATVEIFNPVTKSRIKRTLDGSTVTNFELNINNLDYGDPRDSIMKIDLEVTAENPGYGKTSTTFTVHKPEKVKRKEDANKPINLEPITLKLGQRPKLAAEMAFSNYTLDHPDDPKFGNFKGLVMEEVVTISLYPLLNYVFFDEGESVIPDRYILFKNQAQTAAFSDQSIPGGTFEKYYNILNIYGYRLRQHPDAKLNILGCIGTVSEKEKDKAISQRRAEVVFKYLNEVWGIAEDRLKVESRGLPKLPSNKKDSMGVVENRRVELLCDEWEIVKPIVDRDPTLFPSPEVMTFRMDNGIDNNIVASRRIEVSHGGKPWITLKEVGLTDATHEWDWLSSDGELPKKGDESPFQARLVVTSKNGRECISDPITILVRQISTEDLMLEGGGASGKTLETYNLVLFKFNSDQAGPLNARILKEFVYPRVFSSTEINIVGHTDVVGLYETNKKLSVRRAATVSRSIKKNRSKYKILESDGVGEDNELYTNALPEGRFYNRTVQIVIQTPLEEAQAN